MAIRCMSDFAPVLRWRNVADIRPNQSDTRSTHWGWITAIWLAGGLFDASQALLIMHAEGRHPPWLLLFGFELVSWLPWVLATPIVIFLARRYPIARGASVPTVARTVAIHIAAFAAVSAVTETWSATLQVLLNPWGNKQWPTFAQTWTTTLIFQVLTFLIAYALILTVTYVVDARENLARQVTEA